MITLMDWSTYLVLDLRKMQVLLEAATQEAAKSSSSLSVVSLSPFLHFHSSSAPSRFLSMTSITLTHIRSLSKLCFLVGCFFSTPPPFHSWPPQFIAVHLPPNSPAAPSSLLPITPPPHPPHWMRCLQMSGLHPMSPLTLLNAMHSGFARGTSCEGSSKHHYQHFVKTSQFWTQS